MGSARIVELVAGQPTTISSNLAWPTPPATATISGTLTNAETPLARVVGSAFDAGSHVYVKGVFTDVNGTYTLSGLPAGDYHLRFHRHDTCRIEPVL